MVRFSGQRFGREAEVTIKHGESGAAKQTADGRHGVVVGVLTESGVFLRGPDILCVHQIVTFVIMPMNEFCCNHNIVIGVTAVADDVVSISISYPQAKKKIAHATRQHAQQKCSFSTTLAAPDQ